jgi:tRNA threonylcarbamoyladenosine biosynthesis protein TsaE
MNQRVWTVAGPEELVNVAKELLEFAGGLRVFLLHGDLGAGKTTFVRACCSQLGVSDNVNSPTFSIVQEYRSDSGAPVFHFDLYRIKNQSELFDLGFENYVDSGEYCFIEWPEKAKGLFYQPKADIFITVENGHRVITCSYE